MKTSVTCYSPRNPGDKCDTPIAEAPRGGCRHTTAENMTRAEFGKLPVVRCVYCKHALGRICPDCKRWY